MRWIGGCAEWGGLWALQRQWLRPKKQTNPNQSINSSSTKQRKGMEWKQRRVSSSGKKLMELIEWRKASSKLFEWNGAPSSSGCAASQQQIQQIALHEGKFVDELAELFVLPFLLLFFSFIKQHNSFFLSIKEVDWMKGRELFVFFFIGCCWLWAPLHLTRRELLSLIPLIQSTLLVHQSNLKRRRNKWNQKKEGNWSWIGVRWASNT